MSSRSYGQYCPLARALDSVGERWTLLIVRDLASGPKRYSDLHKGLPGIGTTLLAERLRRLEGDGIVTRVELPPPAASTVYELSDAGHDLLEAMVPLARWGTRYLDDIGADDIRPEWIFMFWQTHLDRDAARDVRDTYELHVSGQTFHVTIEEGSVFAALRPAPTPPDAVVTTDWKTFFALGSGRQSPGEALEAGALSVEGDPGALKRCYELLGQPTPSFAGPDG